VLAAAFLAALAASVEPARGDVLAGAVVTVVGAAGAAESIAAANTPAAAAVPPVLAALEEAVTRTSAPVRAATSAAVTRTAAPVRAAASGVREAAGTARGAAQPIRAAYREATDGTRKILQTLRTRSPEATDGAHNVVRTIGTRAATAGARRVAQAPRTAQGAESRGVTHAARGVVQSLQTGSGEPDDAGRADAASDVWPSWAAAVARPLETAAARSKLAGRAHRPAGGMRDAPAEPAASSLVGASDSAAPAGPSATAIPVFDVTASAPHALTLLPPPAAVLRPVDVISLLERPG
jgi:hypothetical protein